MRMGILREQLRVEKESSDEKGEIEDETLTFSRMRV